MDTLEYNTLESQMAGEKNNDGAVRRNQDHSTELQLPFALQICYQ